MKVRSLLAGLLAAGMMVSLSAMLRADEMPAVSDYLLMQNGHKLVLWIPANTPVNFQYLSLSERSAIVVTRFDNTGSITKFFTFKDGDGWVSFPDTAPSPSSPVQVVIALRETGDVYNSTDLPSDSDVVVRVPSGWVTAYTGTNSVKGAHCDACRRVMTW